jgi:voltage-gated potassium channel
MTVPIRVPTHSNPYNIFILILTVASLIVMVLLLLPLDQETIDLLRIYDNIICFIFLADFANSIRRTRPRRYYIVDQRGWLDLLGSIPSFGLFPAAGLFRIFRLSRLSRIARLMRGQKKKELVQDIVDNRGQYAIFITLLSGMLVLTIASVLVLQFETTPPPGLTRTPNIDSGGDALWWGLVTITTVGYGDYYPVTPLGRLTGIFVMFAGVGIIGALASILASILVPPPKEISDDENASADDTTTRSLDAVAAELASLRAEVAALRTALQGGGPAPG